MARIRQHGFSEREVKIAAAKLMADIESAYLERDQVYSTDVREEYVRNFLHGAPWRLRVPRWNLGVWSAGAALCARCIGRLCIQRVTLQSVQIPYVSFRARSKDEQLNVTDLNSWPFEVIGDRSSDWQN